MTEKVDAFTTLLAIQPGLFLTITGALLITVGRISETTKKNAQRLQQVIDLLKTKS